MTQQAPAPSDVSAMLRLVTGAWITQAVYAAAKLGLADLLRDGPRAASDLAEATATEPRALHRLLRTLASQGVFAEEPDGGRFRLTPLADLLRSDTPGSLRPFAIMMGEPLLWRSFGEFLYSLRTGKPAFDHVFGQPLFDYYADHPEAARIAVEGLTSRAASENMAVVAAYEFGAAQTVVDVGGGQGSLLAAILAANPQIKGVLLDKPHVVEMARPVLDSAVRTGRCTLQAGDFFAEVPPGGDLYLLKKVIHDWEDERAVAILRNIAAAMTPRARLLLVELVVPPGNAPSFAKLLDLLMMVYTGGRERTETEHRALLGEAGFELRRVIPTESTVSIVEAVRRDS
ncbi:methyltransferase [Falsiroseomonas sp. HW251]|uniref:methyltransferase n=1 Tax=Falsiroseomonas sp. HW251 TaxID=3390998 RepID=UPI003D321853